ncbi:hypothetical protein, partial [Legionella gresilensis]|uniref:hypothetical protein n=1 Tax=Legionella gresilensis TaxID=91823 RepID=UPI0013EF6F99
LKSIINPYAFRPARLDHFATPTSFVALVAGKPNPDGPIKQALKDLRIKATTDLTRLINTSAELVKLVYTGVASIFKVLVFVGSMFISRLLGLAGISPGHHVHRGIAKIHNFFRSAGEFLYPARAVKNVVIAHPTSVINKVEESYSKLLSKLGGQVTQVLQEEERPSSPNEARSDVSKLKDQKEIKQPSGPDEDNEGSNIEIFSEQQRKGLLESLDSGQIPEIPSKLQQVLNKEQILAEIKKLEDESTPTIPNELLQLVSNGFN